LHEAAAANDAMLTRAFWPLFFLFSNRLFLSWDLPVESTGSKQFSLPSGNVAEGMPICEKRVKPDDGLIHFRLVSSVCKDGGRKP
jgi:hypothetical protein